MLIDVAPGLSAEPLVGLKRRHPAAVTPRFVLSAEPLVGLKLVVHRRVAHSDDLSAEPLVGLKHLSRFDDTLSEITFSRTPRGFEAGSECDRQNEHWYFQPNPSWV